MRVKTWPALDLTAPGIPASDTHTPGFLSAFLDDFSPTAIADRSGGGDDALAWRVFFGSPEVREEAARAIAGSHEWAPRLRVEAIDVPDEQWAERSQAGLAAVRVGRVVVSPPWDVERARLARTSGEIVVIEIEPSMGFGTGHHESTRLCLRALQAATIEHRRMIDLGTGSGVLAIAAARLGCGAVVGIDDDPDAIEAAADNVRRNGVADRVEMRLGSLASVAAGGSRDALPAADLVVGNLTGGLLRRYAREVASLVADGGALILGGFTLDERLAVVHAFASFDVVREDSEGGWAALTLRRVGSSAVD
jgi:ribosomal protein L11 methyltransferase